MTRRPTTPPAGRAARAFRHLAVLGACAAAVGAFAACGDEASTANGGTGVPEPTTAVTDLPPAANGPECLYGDWVVSDAELGGYFAVVAANTGFDSVDGSGTITMSFTPTGFAWTNDYEVTAVMGADTFVVTQTGSVAGTYTEDDGTLTGNAGTDDRQATFTQNGQPVDTLFNLSYSERAGPIDPEVGSGAHVRGDQPTAAFYEPLPAYTDSNGPYGVRNAE